MKVTLIAILSLLLCSPLIHAQDTKNTDTERRQKAVELLESLATQVASLQSAENRARIGANIAESLWKHNEKRARALFVSIEDDINLGFQDRNLKDFQDTLAVRVFLKLRWDTVQRIAKYDPEFALKFLTATAPQSEAITKTFGGDEGTLELQLAKQIAAANPDIAMKLGRQSLARGVSSELLPVLRQLHRKHREKGITLYKETLQKLHDADLTEDWEATEFARTLVLTLVPPEADEFAYRDLINTLLTTALKAGCDKKPKDEEEQEPFCTQIAAAVPAMEKIDPIRTRKLKYLMPETYDESWGPLALAYSDLEEASAQGSVDEILALAEKYPRIDVSVYSTAMTKAYQSGDVERAKKIANSYPGDAENRKMLVDQMNRAESLSEKTVDEILETNKKAIEQLGLRADRSQLLVGLATQLGPANKQLALKMLDEALSLVETMKSPSEQVQTRLNLASLYCAQGSDRGFEIIQSQMPKLNELIDAAVKLDGFDTSYLRDGEWNMSANGQIGSVLTSMSENAGSFAACDFDRAVSMSGQFERNEIRIMAQVKLAQSVLIAQPSRRTFFNPYMIRNEYIQEKFEHRR